MWDQTGFETIGKKLNKGLFLNKNRHNSFPQETSKRLYSKFCENNVKLMSAPKL